MLAAMDAHPNSKPTPSAKSNVKSSVYHISGVPVEFPYKPYGSQLAFMSRVISTLDRARQQGHCHALLESPTGTGKTLSLLCSSLAWQRHQGRQLNVCISPSNASEPPEIIDPLLHGGGFIPDPHPYGNSEKPLQATKTKNPKKNVAPKIYYASRTHSQISQVIREYRKTSYRVPMAVLASRKHYCTNKYVCSKENVDELCKSLLKDSSGGCLEFKNANKVKSHPSLQIGECFEVHDVEDLVRIGRRVKGCSYFAAQSLAADAKLVFCPYSYVINPIVRKAMDVDIKGCILILDEAHNIEDMAREGGSVDIEEEVLHALQEELGQLCIDENLVETYRPLYDVIEGIVSWINIKKENLQKYEFERYISYWTGEKAKQELHKIGISQYCFPVLQECAIKAIKEAIDAAPGDAHLTGISLITLEGLFSSLSYFFSGNDCHANDYQLALQRYVKRDGSNAARDWTISLSLWCLNPAVVFSDIANLSLSVILTSGTLSPVGSFSSELGVRFDSCMEAPHVINMESQLWAAVVTSGAGNVQLNASYKTADSYAFQDSLGATLEEICKIVPGGALVFFPSYKLLEKLHDRWHQTGQWSKLNMQKDFFIEPRGSSSDFEPVLKDYYDTICGKTKPTPGKIRIGLKRVLKFPGIKDSNQNPNKGAAFLAVCRGKVSEGIDFSDDNARVVVIVGIPFPNKNDIQVMLKKKFNDTYKSSKNLLSGSEWYCHQAFRALNQAAGRCIRHRFDYGAIILLDERYTEQRNLLYVSKWLRSSIKTFKNFDDSLKGLQTFFREAKQNLEENFKELANFSSDKEKLLPSNQATEPVKNLVKTFNNYTGKNDSDKTSPVNTNKFTIASTCLLNDNSSVLQPQTPVNMRKTAEQINEKFLNLNRKVDFQTESLNATFSSQSVSPGSSPDLQMTVKGTPCATSRAEPFTRLETLHQLSEVPLSESLDTTSKGLASQNSCALAETPKKLASPVSFDAKQDPHFDMGINSSNHKKRRLMHLQNTSHHSDAASLQFTLSNSIVNPKEIDKASEYEKVKQVSLILENQNTPFWPSSNDCEEMELHVSCMSCREPLGLPENRFLVKGLFVVSSKAYLSYTNLHESLVSFMPDSLSKIPPAITRVLSSEITVINERIIRALPNNFSAHGVWCEEDGCVFRAVFCPFCTENNNCLGVRVLATDATNVNLLNKVLFFADRLCIIKPKALDESAPPRSCNSLDKCSDYVENDDYSSKYSLVKPAYDTTRQKAAENKQVPQKPAGNNHPKPVEIEKFAYKPKTESVYFDSQPGSGPCQLKASNILITSKSKLKLPRRLSDSSNMKNSRMEEASENS